jgi:uracil-DNA glycosylase family 4
VAFRHENRKKFPDKFNGPVPSFGPESAKLLIVGLAPGLKGANFSGRPFTGDWAGLLLYPMLKEFGLARGEYKARPDDGFELVDCRITNAVRCVPPQNKPLPVEEHTCRVFLQGEFSGLKNVKVILTQGTVAHNSVIRAFGLKLSAYKFKHGFVHDLPNGMKLVDTYHTSRYNTNTGRLTTEMFRRVIATCKALIKM